MGKQAAKRRRVATALAQSGLTQREFARQEGIPLSTLTWWLRRVRKEGGEPRGRKSRFLEVELIAEPERPRPESSVRLAEDQVEFALPDGTMVRMPPGVDEGTMTMALRAARRSSC
jgi:transposase-like protein